MLRGSILLLLCLACGGENREPCQDRGSAPLAEFNADDSGITLPPLEWGLADQELALEFVANEVPTCGEGKATGALIAVTDPLNDELPYTSDLVTPAHGAAIVTVRFRPVRAGRHHVIVRFLPTGGTSQRDLLITPTIASTPIVLPYYCGEVIQLPGGTLICDEKVLRPDGTLAEVLPESVARSAFGAELWATRAEKVAHYREIDAGQLERLEYQSLAEPQNWVKLLGGTGDAIAVTDGALAMVSPDAGGLSVSPPRATVGAPIIRSALRRGEVVYVGGPFSAGDTRDFSKSTVCAYARSGTSFNPLGPCAELAASLVGATAQGFWTFDQRELSFESLAPDGGLGEQSVSLRLPDAFRFEGNAIVLGADQVPVFFTFSPRYAAFAPHLIDGGIELVNLPAPEGPVASANSSAIWWAVGSTTTVYAAP